MQITSFISVFTILIASFACANARGQNDVAATVEQYFATYAARKDFAKLMAFYSQNAVLDDLVYGHLANGQQQIKAFYDWSVGDFYVIDNKPALEITAQIISGNQVTTRGIFNQFSYQGKVMGPWRFIIWQEFNQDGKITYQEDWINYTPKQNFVNGANRNPQ